MYRASRPRSGMGYPSSAPDRAGLAASERTGPGVQLSLGRTPWPARETIPGDRSGDRGRRAQTSMVRDLQRVALDVLAARVDASDIRIVEDLVGRDRVLPSRPVEVAAVRGSMVDSRAVGVHLAQALVALDFRTSAWTAPRRRGVELRPGPSARAAPWRRAARSRAPRNMSPRFSSDCSTRASSSCAARWHTTACALSRGNPPSAVVDQQFLARAQARAHEFERSSSSARRAKKCSWSANQREMLREARAAKGRQRLASGTCARPGPRPPGALELAQVVGQLAQRRPRQDLPGDWSATSSDFDAALRSGSGAGRLGRDVALSF